MVRVARSRRRRTSILIAGFLLIAACSNDGAPPPGNNRELLSFEGHVEACRMTACQTAFPANEQCMMAIDMITSGRPQLIGKDQYIRYLQNRIMLSDAYGNWLEGEAGKSVMGRQYCGKNLQFIENSLRIDSGDD